MANSEFYILVTVLLKQIQENYGKYACNRSRKREPKNF